MSRSFSCPGPLDPWRRSAPADPAFAPEHQGTSSASRYEAPAPMPTWRRSVPPLGRNAKPRASWLSSLCILVAGLQYHCNIGEVEHIALIGDLHSLGVEFSVEQIYPDGGF